MLRAIAMVIFLSLCVSACNSVPPSQNGKPASTQAAAISSKPVTTTSTPTQPGKIVATPALRSTLAALPDPTTGINYRVMPMDKLDISVFQIPDLARSVEVNQSGMISLPLIGQIRAAGLTADQIQSEIEKRLAADYLQNPQVTVSISAYSNRRITVTGAVSRPGVFPLSGETTLLQAIAMSGGIQIEGDPTGIFVFRSDGTGRSVARFDVSDISSGKSPDPTLQAGDVIVVDTSMARTALRDLRTVLPLAAFFIALAS